MQKLIISVGALLGAAAMLATFGACATSKSAAHTSAVVVRETINELEREPVPGTVTEPWIEPIYDSVQVPAQLDPHGVYYRPSHRTLVEIREGKYQKVQYPNRDGSYPEVKE